MSRKHSIKINIISCIIVLVMLLSCYIFNSNAVEGNEIDSNTGNNTTNEVTPPENTTNTPDLPYTEEPGGTDDQVNNNPTTPVAPTTPTTPTTPNTSTTPKTPTRNGLSSNANLVNLGIRPHDFSGFKSGTTNYEVTVPADTESVEVYAQAQDSNAKISGTGTVELQEGENTVNVVVTAEDETTKTYTIIITRQAAEQTEEVIQEEQGEGLAKLVIQNVEITPKFQTNVYEYTAKYIGEETSLSIETEPTNGEYTVEIVGNEELKEGENIITILVSESNGDNVATYQITVQKSLVDEEALAREKAEQEQRQRMIIGGIIVVVAVIAIVVFIIIRRRKNKLFAEEYSGVPFYDMNKDDNSDNETDYYNEDFEEKPKALKKRRKFIEDENYNDVGYVEDKNEYEEENQRLKYRLDDESEKERRQRVRAKFLDGYDKEMRNKGEKSVRSTKLDNKSEDLAERVKNNRGKRYR